VASTAAPRGKRQRRTAEQARREILDAAEKRLGELGPDGLRLQQIAADVGLSHPAILHHFGSREGLLRAVVQRAVESLEADLIRALQVAPATDEPAALDVIERAFRVLVDRGHARVVAWLYLSGHQPDAGMARIRAVAEVAHLRRVELGPPDRPVAFEDTLFRTLLVALTIFGEAVAGAAMRRSAGLDAPGDPARFREWLARLISERER
jgi:AcrR family transcriptional regulator